MRAALLEPGHNSLVVVDDVEIEEPRAGEALVRVSNCGVCHSDLSFVNNTMPLTMPTVLGHEAAGVVVALGPGVTEPAVGDKVVLTPIAACNACYWCVRGEYGSCVNSMAIITSALPDGRTALSRGGRPVGRGVGLGAFAEHVITPVSGAIKVAHDTPLEIACVLGCAVQTGVGAVLNTARVPEGATVLVMGAGGIGISILQGAQLAGAAQIIVADPVAERRDTAKRFGATAVLDPATDDVVSVTQQLTHGIGVDHAFDAVGAGAVIDTCIGATRRGGTTTMVGAGGLDQVVALAPPVVFSVAEKKLVGCLLGGSNGRREIPRLLDLWRAGRLDLEGLITHRRPLDEINDAFADMTAGRGLRTVLTM